MSQYSKIDKHVAEGSVSRILQDRAHYDHTSQSRLPIWYRYVVLDVIFDPTIIDKNKINYWEQFIGVSNIEFAAVLPRNTIIGQRINDGSSSSAETPMFLFPFFPSHFSMPCKPGEHVWVMFEAPGIVDTNLGYWFCKITEISYVDDVNHTHAPRSFDPSFVPTIKDVFDDIAEPKYEFRNGRPDKIEGERYTVPESQLIISSDEGVYEKLLTETDGSLIMKYEKVPRYRKRPGDMAFEGTNNSLVVLGTDRTGAAANITTKIDPVKGRVPTKIESDMDGDAGMIDLVVGRGQIDTTGGVEVTSKKIDKSEFNKELGKSTAELVDKEGDPDIKTDRSRVAIFQRTKIDKNIGVDQFNLSRFSDSKGIPNSGLKDPEKGAGAVLIRSDKVRVIARMDVEILVQGYESDSKGGVKASDDTSKWAAIVIKSSGDIVFKPADHGYIKLGDDTADRAILCTDTPALFADGKVNPSSTPLSNTMGGKFGGTQIASQGTWAKKVLVTGAKLCQRKIQDVFTGQVL